jgi:hypothetical protein
LKLKKKIDVKRPKSAFGGAKAPSRNIKAICAVENEVVSEHETNNLVNRLVTLQALP